ncbi:hypothetical protein PYH37_005635 [Sinorhizobium numidicum]|uniref:Uncharacterized protein n=1 Tax=Sinorhizobium numidicum TaxID=680248 RepID=A0ABY8CZ82_9HYPH|nr:hypothetical protein [Sinorhizobium numidicum]WEX77245.1 hypothetical protein PYH37_005635 [Sinorhizobium numidicum]WEX83904.1 hypothetical protein PYH38_002728 [Sinorhizobium numidicum]
MQQRSTNPLSSAPRFVEAFQNAFLGVLLSDERFAISKAAKRKDFDWLYDHAVETGILESLIEFSGWSDERLLQNVLTERDYEKLAAWI